MESIVKDITYQSRKTITRDRYYSFYRYSDGTAMLIFDGVGTTFTIHLDELDVDLLKVDFNAG